jgi:hypothetical protein
MELAWQMHKARLPEIETSSWWSLPGWPIVMPFPEPWQQTAWPTPMAPPIRQIGTSQVPSVTMVCTR